MIYHVFANRVNVGDWLSARGIGSLLAKHEDRVELLCDGPFVPATLAALGDEREQPDLVVIGGGGLLMDYFDPFWEGLADIARRVPVVLWGVGLCDLKEQGSLPDRATVQAVARASALCVVRDQRTRAYLAPAVDAEVAPCPSFAAIGQRQGGGTGILHATSLTTVGEAADAVMRAAAALVAGPDEPVRETNNEIRPGREDDLRAVVERYAGARVVLSARLHGCILAVATGRPLFAVSGDHKVEEFMTSVGLGHQLLEASEAVQLGPRRLAERVAEASLAPPDPALARRAIARNEEVAAKVLTLVARRGRPTTRSREGALDAWTRVGGSSATRAQPTSGAQPRSHAIFRLEDPSAGRVLAKRGARESIRREAHILTEILGPRNLGPRCFGSTDDPESRDHAWIFVEEVNASPWDPTCESQKHAVSEWLGYLHGSTSNLNAGSVATDGISAHASSLARVLTAIASRRERKLCDAPDALGELHEICIRAAALWACAESLADELPNALVHCNLSPGNVMFAAGLVPVVTGWEHARIGCPAVDAGFVDPGAYISGLVAGGWPAGRNTTEAMVRLGLVLADLEVLDRYASGLDDAWLPTYLPEMLEYATRMEQELMGLACS